MTQRRRNALRAGRFLASQPAATFVPMMPAALAQIADGMDLVARTRPYLTRGGSIRVRLVFRDRDGDAAVVAQWTLCGPLTDAAMDQLSAALGPRLQVREPA